MSGGVRTSIQRYVWVPSTSSDVRNARGEKLRPPHGPREVLRVFDPRDQRGTRPLAAQSRRRPNSSNISNRVNFTFCTALLISCVSCQHSDKSRVKYL